MDNITNHCTTVLPRLHIKTLILVFFVQDIVVLKKRLLWRTASGPRLTKHQKNTQKTLSRIRLSLMIFHEKVSDQCPSPDQSAAINYSLCSSSYSSSCSSLKTLPHSCFLRLSLRCAVAALKLSVLLGFLAVAETAQGNVSGNMSWENCKLDQGAGGRLAT